MDSFLKYFLLVFSNPLFVYTFLTFFVVALLMIFKKDLE